MGEDPATADKVIVRLVPSGILRPGTQCVLGQGMVIDPASLFGEIDELVRRGHLPAGFGPSRLAVSERAHAILPYHVLIDTLRASGARARSARRSAAWGPATRIRWGAVACPSAPSATSLASRSREVGAAVKAWEPHIRALGGDPPDADAIVAQVAPLAPRLVRLPRGRARAHSSTATRSAPGRTSSSRSPGRAPRHPTMGPTRSSVLERRRRGGACIGAGVGPTRIDKALSA